MLNYWNVFASLICLCSCDGYYQTSQESGVPDDSDLKVFLIVCSALYCCVLQASEDQ